mgnify:CR=1 FL=1
MKTRIFLFTSLFLFLSLVYSANEDVETDAELAQKLNSDLKYDVQRRNSFKSHAQDKQVYNREREKGFSLYLEEQEKWDAIREEGIKEYRQSRLNHKVMDETSPEYIKDEQQKKNDLKKMEVARKKYVATKEKVTAQFRSQFKTSEEEELGIYDGRPRFELSKRGKMNRVSKSNGGGSFSSPSASSGNLPSPNNSSGGLGYGPDGSAPFDYPAPTNDFTPPPSDGFEDLPPPPPLMPYDGYGEPPLFEDGGAGFNPGLMDNNYQPPPMDGGWDF